MSGQAKKRSRPAGAEDALDEALEFTFPASDPVAVGSSTATEPPRRPSSARAPLVEAGDIAAPRKRRRKG